MSSLNLTSRELEILIGYVKVSKTDVYPAPAPLYDMLANGSQADWAKVAAESNCKTAKYARDKFALIRNKLTGAAPAGSGDTNGAEGDGEATTPNTDKSRTKAKSTPRKRKTASMSLCSPAQCHSCVLTLLTDADDEDDTPTKSSVKKSASKKSKKAKAANDEEDDVLVKDESNEAGSMMDEMME